MAQLDSSAKLADIIASLQASEGISQKPYLAGVIGGSTLVTDEISKQVSDLITLKSALVAYLIARGKSASTSDSLATLINLTAKDSNVIAGNIALGIVIDGVTGTLAQSEGFEFGLPLF